MLQYRMYISHPTSLHNVTNLVSGAIGDAAWDITCGEPCVCGLADWKGDATCTTPVVPPIEPCTDPWTPTTCCTWALGDGALCASVDVDCTDCGSIVGWLKLPALDKASMLMSEVVDVTKLGSSSHSVACRSSRSSVLSATATYRCALS